MVADVPLQSSDRAPSVPHDVLWDPDFAPNQRPCVIGRQPFGGITIPNSDSGAHAYTDVAIDQAWRAITEIEKSS
jgi:spermidine dehydrogenase